MFPTMLHPIRPFATAAGVTLLCALAAAQAEDARLSPIGAGPDQQFGAALDIQGDTAVISAPGYLGAPIPGAVHVYHRGPGGWLEQQRLTASDGTPGDAFGSTVALSGNTLLVGSFVGQAYVFVFNGAFWVEQQILSRPGLGAHEFFGLWVWLDGDTAVVGAQREGTAGVDSGAAYVFVRHFGVWSLQQRLAPSDAAPDDFAGFAAIAGNTLLLGAFGKDGNRGAVYVFTRSGSTWTEGQKLVASDARSGDLFGGRLALENDTAVITAIGPDVSAGAAYVFTRTAGVWSEAQRLSACDASHFDRLGLSVALSGDALLIGAPFDQDHGPESGSVYLFRRLGTGWVQAQKLVASDAAAGQYVGLATALDNGSILVGAPRHAGAGDLSGLALVYHVGPSMVSYYNGAGFNSDSLTVGESVLGQSWSATIDVVEPHAPGTAFLFVSSACGSGLPVLGGNGEVLLGGRKLLALGPRPHAGVGSSVSFGLRIPPDPGLLGLRWAAQGAVFGGFARLTRAATGTLQ